MPTVIDTARLRLVPMTLEVAEAIVDGLRPADPGAWAPEYPTEGALVAASALVTAADRGEDLGTWRPFQIVRRDTGRVVGGAGCYPADAPGVVQVGYSVAASERGQGLAAEALGAVVAWARRQPGVTRVIAETAATNDEGLEVFTAAGLHAAGMHGDLVCFEA